MVLSKKELGQLIKNARNIKSQNIGHKYTQSMLADELGISRGYLGDIEAGRTYPNYVLLNKIANACGIPFSFFNESPIINSVANLLGITSEKLIEYSGYIVIYDDINPDLKLLDELTKIIVKILSVLRKTDKECYESLQWNNTLILPDIIKKVLYDANKDTFNVELKYPIYENFVDIKKRFGDKLPKYHQIDEINSNEIAMEKSELFNNDFMKDSKYYNSAQSINQNNIIQIPIIGTIRAGQPILAQENLEGYFPTDKQFITSDKEYFYLRVNGDSMDKEFKEGSLVLFQKQNYIDSGEIGVVLINGFDATVKKIFIKDNLITLMPQSNNPEHQLQIYDMSKEEVKILGKVVLAVKKY